MSSKKQQSVAILGAGLLGRLLAWRLLQSGHSITLFESSAFDKPRSAAHTAAAMISPLSEAVVSNKTLYSIGLRSLTFWQNWIQQLNNNNPNDNDRLEKINFSNPGTLAVAHRQDANELQQLKQDLQAILGDDDDSIWLDRQEINLKEPSLEQFDSALYLPHEAYLDNRQLLDNLLVLIQQLGGDCRDNTPIELGGNDIQIATKKKFDTIIDCRGYGAKQSQKNLRGVRGEVLWVHCPELSLKHAIRLMHPRYKLYMVPKPNQRYIIGATEIESEDLSPISVQSTLELASALYTIHPTLAEARIVETDVNLRPAFIDNEPRITINENFISINGLHRHGYLLAPSMVDDVVQWLNQKETSQFWNYYTRDTQQ